MRRHLNQLSRSNGVLPQTPANQADRLGETRTKQGFRAHPSGVFFDRRPLHFSLGVHTSDMKWIKLPVYNFYSPFFGMPFVVSGQTVAGV